MPNRILREGILSSARVNALSPAAELFYRRLISVVDDYGRFHASPGTLRGACWPTCPDRVCDQDVSKWLAECAQLDRKGKALLSIYESDGAKYLELSDFKQQVRSKSKFPDRDDDCTAIDEQLRSTTRARTPSPSHSELRTTNNEQHLAPSEKEPENIAAQPEDKGSSPVISNPEGFDSRLRPVITGTPAAKCSQRFPEFWERYPVKDGKSVACGVWQGLVTIYNEGKVFSCLDRYLTSDRAARSPKNANNWLHDCARDNWESDWPRPAPIQMASRSNGAEAMKALMAKRIANGQEPL